MDAHCPVTGAARLQTKQTLFYAPMTIVRGFNIFPSVHPFVHLFVTLYGVEFE